MRDHERQLWTDFVRKREQRDKPARKRRPKHLGPTPAELEAALDDLAAEAERHNLKVVKTRKNPGKTRSVP
jgi:hypothetical protein